jgi:nitrite reductase/ring-hydroxylating ferredoxin subunit
MRRLCALADIPDGGTLNFPSDDPAAPGLFAYRRDEEVRVYVNSCPHLGLPLDIAPGMFLSADASHFICATHWAQFDPATGACVAGPCLGEHLEQMRTAIEGGTLSISRRTDG